MSLYLLKHKVKHEVAQKVLRQVFALAILLSVTISTEASADQPHSAPLASVHGAAGSTDAQASVTALETSSAGRELQEMYRSDQSERIDYLKAPTRETADKLIASDVARHDRVMVMLREDMLKTADDFYFAAMILQHGEDRKDYELAHLLSCSAANLGSKPAKWLSAASFDRLMVKLGQPQIFGTQFEILPGQGQKMQTIDEGLISDSVRRLFDVPSLEDNKRREQPATPGK